MTRAGWRRTMAATEAREKGWAVARGTDRDDDSRPARTGGKGRGPLLSARGREEAVRRRERLAGALRENLRRRKAQVRGRGAKDRPPAGREPETD
ncbi:MAG: hypothetical protein V3U18_07990 [Alphaproteobacteria bacterium]